MKQPNQLLVYRWELEILKRVALVTVFKVHLVLTLLNYYLGTV
jgi:hypothetical protein